jgi:hypothetical protein
MDLDPERSSAKWSEAMEKGPNEELLRGNLAAARERLDSLTGGSLPGKAGSLSPGLAYAAFDDALRAAGLARGLGEAEEALRPLLATAARAAVPVVRDNAGSAAEGEGEGEEAELVDRSAANPWTLVRGLYAAAVSGERDAARALAAVPVADLRSGQVEASPALEAYAAALQRASAGDSPRGADAELDALLGASGGSRGAGDRFWTRQAEALARVRAGDADGFRAALDRVREALAAEYADAGPNDAERLLELPLLGLEALARRAFGS